MQTCDVYREIVLSQLHRGGGGMSRGADPHLRAWGCRRRGPRTSGARLRRLVDRLLLRAHDGLGRRRVRRRRDLVGGHRAARCWVTPPTSCSPAILTGQFPDGADQGRGRRPAACRGQRQARRPWSSSVDLQPGAGIDFHEPRSGCSAGVLVLYVLASLLQWFQGVLTTTVVQKHRRRLCATTSRPRSTGCRCRYFDRTDRGEVLSRTTNDIDNIAQSFQQTMSQLLTVGPDGHRHARDDDRHLAAAVARRAADPAAGVR